MQAKKTRKLIAGWILTRPFASTLVGSLLMLGTLEMTAVAPLQRMAGATLTQLPSLQKELIGKRPTKRLRHISQQIERLGHEQTVLAGGEVLATPARESSVPRALKTALLRVENRRYQQNYVIDYRRLIGAVWSTLTGDLEGGSGLVQQLSRNFVLKSQVPTLRRKIRELAAALVIQHRYSHSTILRFYCHAIYLGRDVRGFAEAARAYYGTPLDQLGLRRHLGLVALLVAPNRLLNNRPAFVERWETVIEMLYQHGDLSRSVARQYLKNPPRFSFKGGGMDLKYAGTAHALSYLRGRFPDRDTLRTTLNLSLSTHSYEVLHKAVHTLRERTGRDDLDGFVLVARRGTLKTMVGSVRPQQPNHAAIRSAWRPGSLAKPFIYTELWVHGGDPDFRLPLQENEFELPSGKTWRVDNYSDYYTDQGISRVPAYMGLSRSINTATAYLIRSSVGDSLFSRLSGAGYGQVFPSQYPASLLGAVSREPLKVFQLLQAFSRPYGKIPSGLASLQKESVELEALFPARAARQTALTLGYAVQDTLGTAAIGRRLYEWDSRSLRVKTGTAEDHRAASLFVSLPGGWTVLMGVLSRSGRPLRYSGPEEGGVAGATLTPFMNDILKAPALQDWRSTSFRMVDNAERMLISGPDFTTYFPVLLQ